MSLGTSIYGYLSGLAAITSLVGTRIYPLVRPQGGALPAITYQVIGSTHEHVNGSTANTLRAAGLATYTVQVDSWASTYTAAQTIDETLRTKLQGYRGTMGSIVVTGVFKQSSQDLLEQSIEGKSPGDYRVSTDYSFMVKESIPTP